MKLTTTFNKLRASNACKKGYKKLAKALGGVRKYGADTEINLLTILDANGFDDAMWSLHATLEDSDSIKRLIACDFAESVLHIFESKRPDDDRPRKAIESARGFVAGTVSKVVMQEARAAAYAAAYASDAAAYASDASAYAAAYAADAYAAYASAYTADAASDAAYAAYAASDAATREKARSDKKKQLAAILRKHLES